MIVLWNDKIMVQKYTIKRWDYSESMYKWAFVLIGMA